MGIKFVPSYLQTLLDFKKDKQTGSKICAKNSLPVRNEHRFSKKGYTTEVMDDESPKTGDQEQNLKDKIGGQPSTVR